MSDEEVGSGEEEYEQASDEEEDELDDDSPVDDVFAELCAAFKAAGFKPKGNPKEPSYWAEVYEDVMTLAEKHFTSPPQDH